LNPTQSSNAIAAVASHPDESALAGTISVMRRILSKRYGIDKPDLSEDSEISSLGLDSLGFIEYAFDLENELHVDLPDLPRDLSTIGEFARYIHAHLLQQPGNLVSP